MSDRKPTPGLLQILAASCPPLNLASYTHIDVMRLADWSAAVVLCLQEQAEPLPESQSKASAPQDRWVPVSPDERAHL